MLYIGDRNDSYTILSDRGDYTESRLKRGCKWKDSMKDKQDSNNDNNNKKTVFEVMTSATQRVIKFLFLEASSSGSS